MHRTILIKYRYIQYIKHCHHKTTFKLKYPLKYQKYLVSLHTLRNDSTIIVQYQQSLFKFHETMKEQKIKISNWLVWTYWGLLPFMLNILFVSVVLWSTWRRHIVCGSTHCISKIIIPNCAMMFILMITMMLLTTLSHL